MEKYAVLILTALFLVTASPPSVSKHYRSDYKYNSKTNAFYKFHSESRLWSVAKKVCEIEGSQLMIIEAHEDHIQAHGIFKEYPDLPHYAWLNMDGHVHESAEEQPLIYLSQELDDPQMGSCVVFSRTGDVESYSCYQWLPFFCKVKANDAPYNSRCDVYGSNYQYISSMGSCYMISTTAYSWNEAYAECRAENAHLLVLNSLAESQAVQGLAHGVKAKGSTAPWFYLAGYRAHPPQANETLLFKTIFNQTLEEAGFNEWSPNEPNNALGNEFCGTFFTNNGKLNDVNCDRLYGFICEKEIST